MIRAPGLWFTSSIRDRGNDQQPHFTDGETATYFIGLLQERNEVMDQATEWDVLYNHSIF